MVVISNFKDMLGGNNMAKIEHMLHFVLDQYKDNWDGKGGLRPSLDNKIKFCEGIQKFLTNNYSNANIDYCSNDLMVTLKKDREIHIEPLYEGDDKLVISPSPTPKGGIKATVTINDVEYHFYCYDRFRQIF